MFLYDDEGNQIHHFQQSSFDRGTESPKIHNYDPGAEVTIYSAMFRDDWLGIGQLSDYLNVDSATEFFYMDPVLFGLSYNDFKAKIGRTGLMQPEDWPWWGKNLKVVYVDDGPETFACFFQEDRLVTVYRDSQSDKPGRMYSEALDYYSEPERKYTYWDGSDAYEWTRDGFYYQQHVETYDNKGHYRQQYVSFDYEE